MLCDHHCSFYKGSSTEIKNLFFKEGLGGKRESFTHRHTKGQSTIKFIKLFETFTNYTSHFHGLKERSRTHGSDCLSGHPDAELLDIEVIQPQSEKVSSFVLAVLRQPPGWVGGLLLDSLLIRKVYHLLWFSSFGDNKPPCGSDKQVCDPFRLMDECQRVLSPCKEHSALWWLFGSSSSEFRCLLKLKVSLSVGKSLFCFCERTWGL